jgi:hypothetical protein
MSEAFHDLDAENPNGVRELGRSRGREPLRASIPHRLVPSCVPGQPVALAAA